MFLLIQKGEDVTISSLLFTFQYVSINTKYCFAKYR